MTKTPEQIETEAVERFKAEWAAADAEGDAGNRVRRGLRAAGMLASGDLTDETIERAAQAEISYCPFHGDRLAGPRSYRCGVEAEPGHEFAAARVAPAPHETMHVRCDCVPNLGPAHCHDCDVPYSECRAPIAPVTPSPDREKLIAELRRQAHSAALRHDTVLCNALWEAAAALAVPPVVNESPTPVTIARAQQSGKTSALVDAVLAVANERGIAVTIVPPLVNEAKLAEAFGRIANLTGASIRLDVAIEALVERQHEWLA